MSAVSADAVKTATRRIEPAERIRGHVAVNGDKSISHRALMLAGIADGTSVITGLSDCLDVSRTADCMRALGVTIEDDGFAVKVTGTGLRGLRAPDGVLDAGNSGTTMRLLSGILAGSAFEATLDGDKSLRRRPMARIVEPLRGMGAAIETAAGEKAPLRIRGASLTPADYALPMASAQVKSAILLAGLYAPGKSTVRQPAVSRDHTERMLRHFGVEVSTTREAVSLVPGTLQAKPVTVPGDFSSGIFLAAAALVLPDSALLLHNLGINPTRSFALRVLQRAGARIAIEDISIRNNEEIADIGFQSSELTAFEISGGSVPLVIDEIPMLAVLATQAKGRSVFKDARELRVKESDRISSIVGNLKRMGATVREFDDGFEIDGPVRLQGATIDPAGDHRIAMAFAVAGLIADGETRIEDAEVAAVSYPAFYDTLEKLSS